MNACLWELLARKRTWHSRPLGIRVQKHGKGVALQCTRRLLPLLLLPLLLLPLLLLPLLLLLLQRLSLLLWPSLLRAVLLGCATALTPIISPPAELMLGPQAPPS